MREFTSISVVDATPMSPVNLGLSKYFNESTLSKLEPLAPITSLAKLPVDESGNVSSMPKIDAERTIARTAVPPLSDWPARSVIDISSETGRALMRAGVDVLKVINDMKEVGFSYQVFTENIDPLLSCHFVLYALRPTALSE